MRDVDGGRANTQCVIASKRKRMILTFKTKRKILQKVGNGQSDAKVAKMYYVESILIPWHLYKVYDTRKRSFTQFEIQFNASKGYHDSATERTKVL